MSENHLADAELDTTGDDEAHVDAPKSAAQADDGPSSEDQALRMGWTPKEQFKGDPAKWVDAETFIRRGEEFLPFLKANNKRLEDALRKAETRIESLDKAVKRSVEHMSRADERAYTKARADLERELEAAASAGNVDDVKAITKDIADLEKDTVKPPKAEEPEEHPAFTDFKADNPWFAKDAALRGAAIAIADELIADGMTRPERYLPQVAKRIREEFPHKFENPKRREPGAVEAGGGSRRMSGKTKADLPADARQFMEELVRDKITTEAKYLADYFKDAK